MAMPTAAPRSSSPSAPALSISPAVSVPTATAGSPRVRSRDQASTISEPAIRLSPAASISRTESVAPIADFNPSAAARLTRETQETSRKSAPGTAVPVGASTPVPAPPTVNGGILQVDGSIASSSAHQGERQRSALPGTGTVGNTTIAMAAYLRPATARRAPDRPLTVNGNLAFQSGALYLVQLNPSPSFANVTGTATRAATSTHRSAPAPCGEAIHILTDWYGQQRRFPSLDTPPPPEFAAASSQLRSTHAYLNFALDFRARVGLNINQQNVDNATNFFNGNGGIPLVFVA